jgi:hypothetical protein
VVVGSRLSLKQKTPLHEAFSYLQPGAENHARLTANQPMLILSPRHEINKGSDEGERPPLEWERQR